MIKKAFTLFEIVIVVILISVFYLFAISSFSNNSTLTQQKVQLLNLKEELLKKGFEEKITIKCIADEYSCFVFIDGEKQDEMLDPLFEKKPIIYKYEKNPESIEFSDYEAEQLDRYEIVFEFSCKKNKKCDEYIIETENMVYAIHNLALKPHTFEYMNDINEMFEAKIREVRDAF